jgi:excisionase family DNA binding protein
MKEFLSIRDVADLVGMEYKTIYALVKRGELPAAMIGGQFRIKRTDFEAYFEQQKAALQQASAVAKTRRICSSCGKVLVSVLSVKGSCEACAQPICADCWNIAGLRSCQEHRTPSEPEAPSLSPLRTLPAGQEVLQCSLCGRGISSERFIAGHCEEEGCGAPLCSTCVRDTHRTCGKHLLTNAQKLEQARAALAQGKLTILVEAEAARLSEDNFISRFEMKLKTLEGMRNPFDGRSLRLGVHALNWERRDEKAKIASLFRRKPVHPELFTHAPLNQVLRVRIPLRRGIARQEQVQLIIVAQCYAHLEAYVRQGFDTEPANRAELLSLLEQYMAEGRQQHIHYILGLASPTGWTQEARELIFNPNTPSKSFSHEWLSPCLITPTPFELTWNPLDDRLEPFTKVFHPELAGEEIERAINYVQAELLRRNSLSLAEVNAALGIDPMSTKRAFEKLAAHEDFALDHLKDFGLVISNKGF